MRPERARRRNSGAYLDRFRHMMTPFGLPWLANASYSAFNIVVVVVLGCQHLNNREEIWIKNKINQDTRDYNVFTSVGTLGGGVLFFT